MNKMTNYKVTFYGFNGEASVKVASDKELSCENEALADELIDRAIVKGYGLHGKDFRDRLDTYSICVELCA